MEVQETLEEQLDDFDYVVRSKALEQLCRLADKGQIKLARSCASINLHCHSFFSYNACGYSPSHIAWLARKQGLVMAGIVDFDVLDGVDEFFWAGKHLGLSVCAGLETRVFVPEFSDVEINSPGEPGVAYHMGIGFTADITKVKTGKGRKFQRNFLDKLRNTARKRNLELMERVNEYLSPVELDYKQDVQVLTPGGNVTERHMCLAYARKARQLFVDGEKLLSFWNDKLGGGVTQDDLPEGLNLLNMIRSKTMKKGGVGYVQPDKGSFVNMDKANEFFISSGAIPTLTWLNGSSAGEQKIEELLEMAVSKGVEAVNVIPDRNYTPGQRDGKLACLYEVILWAQEFDLPVIVGTEMNSPGQKFVDDFTSRELKPLIPVFVNSANIIYGHTLMQRYGDMGYCSEWARENFVSREVKNLFYQYVGFLIELGGEDMLVDIEYKNEPEQILEKLATI